MTRIYDNRGFAMRNWASSAILAAAFCWGLWEIWRAAHGMSDPSGYLFGIGFVGAAIYGAGRVLDEARDAVVRLETDGASGRSVIVQWRPWGLQRIEGPLDRLSGWRFHVRVGNRNQRTYLLRFELPDRARPLQIELTPTMTALDGLRAVAPEAIAEFEAARGGRRAR